MDGSVEYSASHYWIGNSYGRRLLYFPESGSTVYTYYVTSEGGIVSDSSYVWKDSYESSPGYHIQYDDYVYCIYPGGYMFYDETHVRDSYGNALREPTILITRGMSLRLVTLSTEVTATATV